jgi:hypothetical protein
LAVGVDTEGIQVSPPLLVQVAYRAPDTGRVVVVLEAPQNGRLSVELVALLGDASVAKAFCAADGDTDALGCPVRNIVDVQAWAKTGIFGPACTHRFGLAHLGSLFACGGAPVAKNKKGWTYFAFLRGRPHAAWPCLQQQSKLCTYAAADAWMTLEVHDAMQTALASHAPPSSQAAAAPTAQLPPRVQEDEQPSRTVSAAPGILDNSTSAARAAAAVCASGTRQAGAIVSAAHAAASAGAIVPPLQFLLPPPPGGANPSSSASFFCVACRVSCSSAVPFAEHCAGKKHSAVLRRAHVAEEAPKLGPAAGLLVAARTTTVAAAIAEKAQQPRPIVAVAGGRGPRFPQAEVEAAKARKPKKKNYQKKAHAPGTGRRVPTQTAMSPRIYAPPRLPFPFQPTVMSAGSVRSIGQPRVLVAVAANGVR